MKSLEEVMSALEMCVNECNGSCPYRDNNKCEDDLMEDVLWHMKDMIQGGMKHEKI